ncbi:hypothetical protein QX249_12980 [Vibrio parahaemolyticus]|uniref:Uncharacterized protein n=1 Tax=Vibrio parahaemolyticus TaxID=670 RepID=A0AAW8Q2Q9_VIBPH|nr:hypothetical protein [Vibrio parahaemolyticus]MDS1821580.1 hypothetical protein [Vibrio parahaemolyticus]
MRSLLPDTSPSPDPRRERNHSLIGFGVILGIISLSALSEFSESVTTTDHQNSLNMIVRDAAVSVREYSSSQGEEKALALSELKEVNKYVKTRLQGIPFYIDLHEDTASLKVNTSLLTCENLLTSAIKGGLKVDGEPHSTAKETCEKNDASPFIELSAP